MLAFALSIESRTIELTRDDAGIDTPVGVLVRLKGSGTRIRLRTPLLSSVTPWGDPAITEIVISHGGDESAFSRRPARSP